MSDDEAPAQRIELTLGRPDGSRLANPPSTKFPGPAPSREAARERIDAELRDLERGCALKGLAAQLAGERQRAIEEGSPLHEDLSEREERLVLEAEAAGCDLAPWGPGRTIRAIATAWDSLALCFQTLGRAIDLSRQVATRSGLAPKILTIEQALQTMAEAQSALRVAVQRISSQDDAVQLAAYHWIEDQSAKRRIFLKRFMRKQDLANPDDMESLIQRIAGWEQSLRGGIQRQHDFTALVEAVSRASSADSDAWHDVESQVDKMLREGLAASDSRLRTILTPLLGSRLAEMSNSQAMSPVAKSWEEFLASRETEERDDASASGSDGAEVATVANWLRGRVVVLLGGDRRAHAAESLQRAFGLTALEWISTREHESITSFEAPIARPEVAVVLLAIRWASHAFGEVLRFCESHGKILVRLPSGYNPNQVALQILEQAGERLRAAAETPMRGDGRGRGSVDPTRGTGAG